MSKKYTILKDTREQNGYHFNDFDYHTGSANACAEIIDQKLDTGDYSIQGFEDKICIERKACVEELANNLGHKKEAFINEIKRMEQFPHKYLILEFSLKDLLRFPENTRISMENKALIKITGRYMLKCLIEFQLNNNVHVLFCGDRKGAIFAINSIFKRITEIYTNKGN
jgi:ERCC4-type nuclease